MSASISNVVAKSKTPLPGGEGTRTGVCGEVDTEGRGRLGADAPGSKNSTPDWKFIVVLPVVTWIAAETRSRAAAPLRGPRAEALKGIVM